MIQAPALLLLLLAAAASAAETKWVHVDAGDFTFSLPAGYTIRKKVQGSDPLTGSYQVGRMIVLFHWGPNVRDMTVLRLQKERTTIERRYANLGFDVVNGQPPYVAVLYVPAVKAGGMTKNLDMSGESPDIRDVATMRGIFSTLRFKKSRK